MLKLYRVTGIPEHEDHETYIVASQNVHEEIQDSSVYKEKEDWMDFSGISVPCVDYTDRTVFPVCLSEKSEKVSEEHQRQYEYRKDWILSKIDKWLLQQPEGVSLEDYLLSKQNLKASPYAEGISTLSADTENVFPGTNYCPYCHEKYFNGLCLNPDCPSGQSTGFQLIKEEDTIKEIPE